MEEIRFKRQQLLSSKKKTAMYKRNMTMFTQSPQNVRISGSRILRKVLTCEEGFK